MKKIRQTWPIFDRLDRERITITAMVRLYCRKRHDSRPGPCEMCQDILDYALARVAKCPFVEQKPDCAGCGIHCYRSPRKEGIQEIMRYAGPRMFFRHPLLALFHLTDKWRDKSPAAARKSAQNA